MDDLVAQYLEKLRRRLLDLSARNQFLNFRFSERSRTQVRFINESPDQILDKLQKGSPITIAALPEPLQHDADEDNNNFRLLLEARRSNHEEYIAAASLDEVDSDSGEFQQIERKLRGKVREELNLPPLLDAKSLSKSDYAQHHGINPEYDLAKVKLPTKRKSSRRDNVQTLLYPDELERKLSGLREGARKSIQETGLNTLYLAVGMLEWYESKQSDQRFIAPLLLYPITLKRQIRGGQYSYTLRSCSEELEENFSLKERLRKDYGIVLPEFVIATEDGQTADTLESYFGKVSAVIPERWKVRCFLTLSLFSFGRIALFQDLNPERWTGKSSILKNPIISSLLCGQERSGQDSIALDYEVDSPKIAKKVPLLITDTDASQFSAIVDAIDGKNLVIEGPPGTGKSQTITNLIAVALAQGKKVLFVAEKKAALDVVYNRLAAVGLENYCLEVHSTATSKQAFYDRLKQRIEQETPVDVSENLNQQIDQCGKLKQQLSKYVQLLNQPFGATGKTIQELIWATQQAKVLLPESLLMVIQTVTDEQAVTMRITDFQDKYQDISNFRHQRQELLQKYGEIRKHPWYGLGVHELSSVAQNDLLAVVWLWSDQLKQLLNCSHQASELLEIKLQPTLAELCNFKKQLEKFPVIETSIEAALLPALKSSQTQESLLAFLGDLVSYRKDKKSLERYFADRSFSLPDIAHLRTLEVRLEKNEIYNDYTIKDLKELSDRTGGFYRKFAQYEAIVTEVAGLVDLDVPLSSNDIKAISFVSQLICEQSPKTLSLRTSELCDPDNHVILVKAKAKCEQLKILKDELSQKYKIDACQSSDCLKSYASKLRGSPIWSFFDKLSGAHLFSFLDSDYNKAKHLWESIQKQSGQFSNSEIADIFEKIAHFQDELSSFTKDSKLHQICGQHFQGLDTDFNILLLVSSFAASSYQRLSDSYQGRYFTRFLMQADIAKIEKIGRLQKSLKFQSLLDFIDSLTAEKDFDDQQNWQEVSEHYQKISLISVEVYEALSSFGLQSSIAVAALPKLIQEIEHLNGLRQKNSASEAINTLGYLYQEEQTDIPLLEATVNFAKSVTQSELSQAIQEKLLSADVSLIVEKVQSILESLSKSLEQEDKHRQSFFKCGKPEVQDMFGVRHITDLQINSLVERIDNAASCNVDLSTWINYHSLSRQLADGKIQSLLDSFEQHNLELEHLEHAYQFVFYQSILRQAYQEHPKLGKFSGVTQSQAREEFQEADRALLRLYQKHLVSKLAEVTPNPGNGCGRKIEWTDLALINHEIKKQKRHISQRELFRRAGGALQQLKPCWMMSPTSVAKFIAPDSISFDILIIDEASQMRPEEALGAIARAKQLVVVGDPKQLPPSDFFTSRFDHDVDESDEGDAEILDDESILDMALNVFYPPRRLKWHYRSRHESLIAFSNQHFYDNSLTIFPSPTNRFAVKYQYIELGVYRAGINIPEAMVVAQSAADFIRQHPELSLGIVTMNQKQQELLRYEMDRLFASHPELEQYRADRENTLEPFFVKNLENVQGDERDVIFISTVYGREKPDMPVAQRFGPINSRSGHRRLNVLFTRAKEQIVVFSSMKSSDIRPTATSNRGVHILKDYLEYAQTQRLHTGMATGREPDSDFEIFVAERLRRHGLEVVYQVGVAGYFIDLAIVDPQRPGTYLLGVECDGAAYHSSKSARDRDRLRQEVLEGLGWKIYRIWSTDWFSNPEGETKKLVAYIQTLGR
jgi:superfamily I DNA and/or RNA helicase/very-short-patch-repair endonuclease